MFALQLCNQSFDMACTNYCHNPFPLCLPYFFGHKLISLINQNMFHFRRLFRQHLHGFRKCITFLEFFNFFFADFFTNKQTGKELSQYFHPFPKRHSPPSPLQSYLNISICQHQCCIYSFCSVCCFQHFCTWFNTKLRSQTFLEGSHDQICKQQK